MISLFRIIPVFLFSFLMSPLYAASFEFPVYGKIIREYVKNKTDGIDISAPEGTPVVAAETGVVGAITSVTAESKNPSIIVLKHKDNLLTVYGGLGEINVKEREKVFRGQTIGKVGPGGPSFLHFEVRQGFQSLDPMGFLKKEQNLTIAEKGSCSNASTDAGKAICSAAEQGDAENQFELGLKYLNGKGVVKNFSHAKYWFAQAANSGRLEAEIMLENIQFEKPYKLLKSGDYPEAVAGFKRNVSIGYPVSFIYLSLETIRLEYAAGNDVEEFGRKTRAACDKLRTRFREYLELWNNHAPLYAALAFCTGNDKAKAYKFLKNADLMYDPFAKALRAFLPAMMEDGSTSLYEKRIFYSEAALFGYCPAIIRLSEKLMQEEGISKPDHTMAYAWINAGQRIGCVFPTFKENKFRELGLNHNTVEQYVDELIVRIDKKQSELKISASQDSAKDRNFSDAPEYGLMGKPMGNINGVVLSNLTDSLRDEYKIDPKLFGVVVTSVDETSFAYKSNLRKGDLITDVKNKSVKSVEDIEKLVSDVKSEGLQSILLLVQRDGQARFIILKIY